MAFRNGHQLLTILNSIAGVSVINETIINLGSYSYYRLVMVLKDCYNIYCGPCHNTEFF